MKNNEYCQILYFLIHLLLPFISSPSVKKKTLSVEMNRGVFVLLFLISIIFLFLAAFSVSYHNKNATNGYKLQVLAQDREGIMAEIENLEMQIAEKSALSSLDDISDTQENFRIKPRIIYIK